MSKELIKNIIDRRSKILEDFAQAYIAETGLMPSEIEMCEQNSGFEIRWFFRKRIDENPTLNSHPEADEEAW